MYRYGKVKRKVVIFMDYFPYRISFFYFLDDTNADNPTDEAGKIDLMKTPDKYI